MDFERIININHNIMYHIGPIQDTFGYKWKANWRPLARARAIHSTEKAERDWAVEQRIVAQVLKSIKLLIKNQRNEKIRSIINDVCAANGV